MNEYNPAYRERIIMHNFTFMRLTQKTWVLIAGLLLLLATTACNNDEDIPGETLEVNQWIYENMSSLYLWYDQMPKVDYTQEKDPEEYFYKLLPETDKWSYITDDYASLGKKSTSNTLKTMGYHPSFFLLPDNSVIMAVSYVYPGSAADVAGLKRGDIILSVDDKVMNQTNYYETYSGNEYTVQLGSLVGNTLYFTGESISLSAKELSKDPAIYNTIFNINQQKIGYLVYVEFLAGEDDEFHNSLNEIFSWFASAGITELIVDLRYNPGGEGDEAIHLASGIAPANVVAGEEVLARLDYNNILKQYLISKNLYDDQSQYLFNSEAANVDLDRVYFLTTSETASASELVISGLEPYMEVIQIGGVTAGKYVGSWIIPDENEEWAIAPIVMNYANADGNTVNNGLIPDYVINDNVMNAPPFGDTSDPMVAKALELAVGFTSQSSETQLKSTSQFEKITPYQLMRKQQLIFPVVGQKGTSSL